MGEKLDRVVWLGEQQGERTKTAILAVQQNLIGIREVLGPAPLLSVRVADDFNTDHTPSFIRERMQALPEGISDRVHRTFRMGRPEISDQEAFSGAAVNRMWATGHSEIYIRPKHAYALAEGLPEDRYEAARVLSHEYGHVRANGRGEDRIRRLNGYNPHMLSRGGARTGAETGMSEYFAIRAERQALHTLHGQTASGSDLRAMAKDFSRLMDNWERLREINPQECSRAAGYLSGTLNAHLDADAALGGSHLVKSQAGTASAIHEFMPAGSRGQKFLNQTRGSYAGMREALESGKGVQKAYVSVVDSQERARAMLGHTPVMRTSERAAATVTAPVKSISQGHSLE